MAPQTPARPGVVAGLRLLRQVGRGGEGEVWEARDVRGRRRALKLIRPAALVAPEEVERRGRWLLRVDHPALVRVRRGGVLRGGVLDGWGFVEMDFVDGASLRTASADREAFERLAPLAEGLDLLHAGKWSDGVPLVHRDVKPANLIAGPHGLVLVDHSTMRAVDGDTATRIGTPVFAAPEVITGRIGPAADVYSFAVTALALLTGARGEALADLLACPDELDVPEGMKAALAPAPGDRPVSCRAALDPERPVVLGRLLPDVDVFTDEGPTGLFDDLDGGRPADPSYGGEERLDAAPRPVAGWLGGLAVVSGLPLLAAAAPAWPEAAGLLAAAVGLHLAAQRLARRPLTTALLVPPLAWGFLLADRAAPPGRRRHWARAACTGSLLTVFSALLAPLAGRLGLDHAVGLPLPAAGTVGQWWQLAGPVALLAATLLVTAAAVAASRGGGRLARLLLLPVWAIGAGFLAAGGVVLLPLAALTGRLRPLAGVVGGTLAGALAFVRPQPVARHNADAGYAGDPHPG